MDVTETMDTEIHDTREMLRRFYGDKKFAQMEEEMKQKWEVEQKEERNENARKRSRLERKEQRYLS